MRFFFIILLFTLVEEYVSAAGSLRQAPWQQKADCKIDVQLHPETKTLEAFIDIHYFNNSPDTLRSIWLHIWPNAYKDNNTAFAQQQLQKGSTDFYISKDKEKGYINGFDFRADGASISWQADKVHEDILEIKLTNPLFPGTSVHITTPFHVKLPKIFSRGGYKDSFFALTQWYPKPAVYDVNGWNTMPYLDQGEFYSEFGNYTVNIIVPKAYKVASTGRLLQEADSVSGALAFRKYRYSENNIHDFAWFACNTFTVRTRSILIGGRDSIKLNVYTVGDKDYNEDRTPMYYLDKGITEYSERVGRYPYSTCTVVIGPLEAGGGMEYPTITICSSGDGTTIMHEVGHNWFYGILATNERQYPWMDESINTFYEQLISGNFKPETGFFKRMRNGQWIKNYQDHLGYMFSSRQGISQPLNIASADFTRLNYGAIVYAKGPLLFAYLRQQLGDSLFTACVKNYYQEWQFRHPLPGDMEASFEKTSGMDLDWFFKDLLNENNEVDLVRKGDGFKVKGSKALDSFLARKNYADANPYGFLPEKNYMNNNRKKLISIAFPASLPRHNAHIAVNLTPIAGFNYYDKWYFGALLYNRSIFRNKIEYTLMPAYSFTTESMVGYGRLNALFLSRSRNIYKVETGVQGHSFGRMTSSQLNQYYRVMPYLEFYFRDKGKVPELVDKKLVLSFYHTGLFRDYSSYKDSNNIEYRIKLPSSYFFNYLKMAYVVESRHPVNAYRLQVNGEYGYNNKFNPGQDNYAKAWINAWYRYAFSAKNKFFRTELFAGVFLHKKGNIGPQAFYLSANTGEQDYSYSEALLGRSENLFTNTVIGRQLINANGNMRNLIPVPGSDKWMLALNNEISLPGIIPFRIYADLGFYQYSKIINGVNTGLSEPELYTTAGITLPLFKGMFEIFVPVYQSEQFRKVYKFLKFNTGDVIGFRLDLNRLNLFKMIDNNRLF